MLGGSVYLNRAQHSDNLQYIQDLARKGYQGVFTSLHIPEEDASQYLDLLTDIGQVCKNYHLGLAVDISGNALEKIGLSLTNVKELKALGVSCIRPDYGINDQVIAQLSHHIDIALNASTLTQDNINQLRQAGANFKRMEAWHNYYPRPETGLSSQYFRQKNRFLKEVGLKVMAFIPGNSNLRGPLFQGLPTLEKHRQTNPLAALLELKHEFQVDKIYIADPGLTDFSQQQIQTYLQNDTFLLRAQASKLQLSLPWPGLQHNRQDPGAYAIRSQEARDFYKDIPIAAENILARQRGSVTVDNDLYQRYKGELQLVRRDLPADKKVNVLGQIIPEDRDLLDWILPGQAFEIQWIGGSEHES